jgi:LPXTG-motif cell wall-anchored protein
MRTLKLLALSALFLGALAVPAAAQTYPPSGGCALVLSRTVVPAGDTVVASTTGSPCYAPGSSETLTFTSDPVTLGTVTANANGQFSVTLTIPSNATAGAHTITSSGPGASGGTLVLSASLTVTRAGAPVAGAPGRLAFTGSSDTAPLLWIALVALVSGAALVVGARRRSTMRSREVGSR